MTQAWSNIIKLLVTWSQLSIVMKMFYILMQTSAEIGKRKRSKLSKRSKRYYTYGTKMKSFRIAVKSSRLIKQFTRMEVYRMQCLASENVNSNNMSFDSDSFIIGVDTHASCTMSNNKNHFKGTLTKAVGCIDGIDGSVKILGRGTVHWDIADDSGKVHTIKIPNSIYAPALTHSILSPQHWSQQVNDNSSTQHGTY